MLFRSEILIDVESFSPIQTLKTAYLGSVNPRLHTNEMLIALSLSARTNPNARKALEQLSALKNTQAHITSRVSNVDLSLFTSLGIQITYEAQKG